MGKQMRNPIEMLQGVIPSDTFLYFGDEQEKPIYARYLSYKAIQAAYALCPAHPNDNRTWDSYCRRFVCNERLRQAARVVINDTLCAYAKTSLAFQAVEAGQQSNPLQPPYALYAQALPLGGELLALSLYDSEREEKQTVHYFFLLVEISYYAYRLQRGQRNTWEDYLIALQNNPALREVLCLAFYDALLHVDFTAGWRQAESQTEGNFLSP